MISSLADWNPLSVLYYKWGYSLEELKDMYAAKSREYSYKKKLDYKFLIDLTKAALGGGGKSSDDVPLDDGTGIAERTEEQDSAMREMLGDDYSRVVGT